MVRMSVDANLRLRPDSRLLAAMPMQSANGTPGRVQRAKRLLDSTDLAISEIAFRTGCASLRRFNAFFADGHARFMKETKHSNWLKNPDAKTGDSADLPEFRK